jgi:hypothetical protein
MAGSLTGSEFMPFNLQIIRTSDFIRLNAKGEYDSAASRAVLSKLAKAIVEKGIDSALIDVRDARSDMRLNDVYELAMAFKEMGFQKRHRLAILYRSTAGEHLEFFAMRPGERAQFFAMCASEEGLNVRAFDDYAQAMEWFAAALPVE